MQSIGILGGTFDPIHCGHLRLALEVRETLGLDSVRLLPAPRPQLRDTPLVSADQRVRLLQAALAGVPQLLVDERELARSGPTYTYDTLRSLRDEFANACLCFIVGMDAFSRLNEWYRWRDLLALCHLIVATRPGAQAPGAEVAHYLAQHRCDDFEVLRSERAGRIAVSDITALDISATKIRSLLGEGRTVRFLVPDAVNDMLQTERLYAPDQ